MKQIIFDCDGVIVDSEIEAAKALVKEFAGLGIEITLDYHFKHHSGRTFKTIFEELRLQKKIPSHVDISASISKIESDSYANIKPIANIQPVLHSISYPKAVVSNGRIQQIQHALKVAKVSSFFNGNLFSSTMVKNPKPSPEIYLFAAKQMQVNPNECLVIEDSITGVSAAVAAGMTVISFIGASHILDGHREKVIAAGALTTFDNMEQLPQLLDNYTKT